jgi:hypothetical protein
MTFLRHFVLFCIVALPVSAQQIIDRIVTVVNGRVITQNDWAEQERFEELADGRPPQPIQHSPAALERLIDRVLLLQQMAELNFRPPSPELVQQQIDAIKKQFPPSQTGTETAWAQTLNQYGIPEEDFNQIVTEHANVLRFIDVRFRSNTRIAPYEIENYYRDSFLPEFKKSSNGQAPPPLKQVQDKIQQILLEQRVSEGLNSLLQSLHTQAVIRTITASPEMK